ncbi:RnfABCDGE type electron transport complex subunit G [Caldisalinibacter kiritimatiensis]|uniref:Ion-translocating oxidoreductase complex subunit G n=1 Tax=Caldisalinibacter kiritimatiensis TaxID=1304284 RepID=R1AT71_9FIRM|nr:RnfABCDGE type electron transport complex subunit G [Caldisalinibacter kiritimatiensis]EOC99836.1 Electron transport complex protein RnfG [Caldisalinibacter kiritimatiensis]
MREVTKLGLMLLLITSVAAIVLAFSNNVTSDIIAEVEAKANDEARKEVLPQADSFKQISEETMKSILSNNERVMDIYAGYSNDTLVGYTIKTKNIEPGYAGDIEMIVGISQDGKVTGVKVVSHGETPGLGANAETPEYRGQYEGKSVDNELIVVKSEPANENEIQAITGATITSRAVTSGVNNAIEIFNTELAK